MKVIGLTGPTGAGKTTALRLLEELGAAVIDCDAVYHELLESNNALQQELKAEFGDLINADGFFDRKALGRLVFGNEAALAALNRIAHPHVGREVERLLAQAEAAGYPAAAVDAIALVESGLAARCHATVAVVADSQARLARIMAREGLSRPYAQARINAQKPEGFYIGACTHTLRNDGGDPGDFIRRAKELFVSILRGETE